MWTRTCSTRSCSTRRSSSSTCSGSPTRRRRALPQEGLRRSALVPRGAADVPAGAGVAAQVLGYAGVENHGLGGLELQYDRKLSGRAGAQTIVRDPTGRAIDVISSRPVQEGADVFSTLDHTIQAQAEKVLRETVSKWGAKDATAIVLDPTTGESSRWRRRRGTTRTHVERGAVRAGPAAQPRRHGHLRAGVDLQARHGHGGALGSIVTPETRFTLPYLSARLLLACTVHDAELRGTSTTRSRRSCPTRRTSALSRSPRSSVRSGSSRG